MTALSAASQQRLLNWFDEQARPLPWRSTRDPYQIWVSEVMLQQTTVATVTPRFLRFLQRFPSLQALADADEQAVLHEWEGLGYYRRARHLHQAAKRLVADHGGVFPQDESSFRALPGVGRYIVGAVLSQAFEVRLPIVEANTRRVLTRLFGQQGELATPAVEKWLWDTATAILPKARIGDFNQALMELGALVCTPAQPQCARCPLKIVCVAQRDGLQESIPRKAKRLDVEHVHEVCVVPMFEGKVLLLQRGGAGRWANMWEFPKLERRPSESAPTALRRLRTLHQLKGRATPLLSTNYTVTHHRIALECFRLECPDANYALGEYVAGSWLPPAELASYPVSTAQRKLATALVASSTSLRAKS